MISRSENDNGNDKDGEDHGKVNDERTKLSLNVTRLIRRQQVLPPSRQPSRGVPYLCLNCFISFKSDVTRGLFSWRLSQYFVLLLIVSSVINPTRSFHNNFSCFVLSCRCSTTHTMWRQWPNFPSWNMYLICCVFSHSCTTEFQVNKC